MEVMKEDVTQLSIIVGPCAPSVFEGFNVIFVLFCRGFFMKISSVSISTC